MGLQGVAACKIVHHLKLIPKVKFSSFMSWVTAKVISTVLDVSSKAKCSCAPPVHGASLQRLIQVVLL